MIAVFVVLDLCAPWRSKQMLVYSAKADLQVGSRVWL